MKFGAFAAAGELEKFPEPTGALRGFPSGRVSVSFSLSCVTVPPCVHHASEGLFHKPIPVPLAQCPSQDGTWASLPKSPPPAEYTQAACGSETVFAFHSQEIAEPLVADCSVPLSLSP